jgi:hypothetical protein
VIDWPPCFVAGPLNRPSSSDLWEAQNDSAWLLACISTLGSPNALPERETAKMLRAQQITEASWHQAIRAGATGTFEAAFLGVAPE